MPNIPWAWKSFWMHAMELLGDVCLVESHFDPLVHSVSVGAWFPPFGTVGEKSFWTHPMVLLGD